MAFLFFYPWCNIDYLYAMPPLRSTSTPFHESGNGRVHLLTGRDEIRPFLWKEDIIGKLVTESPPYQEANLTPGIFERAVNGGTYG